MMGRRVAVVDVAHAVAAAARLLAEDSGEIGVGGNHAVEGADAVAEPVDLVVLAVEDPL
jgi:hypothetical protein